jgi:DNA polymerase-1
MSERPTLYVLDAFSMIFQVFHAIQAGRGPGAQAIMTGPAGQPTNAVFGIFRDMLNLIKQKQPTSIAAAFDGEKPVFRSELFAGYKANRTEMPEDLRPQIEVIRRLFEGFRVPVLIEEGFEADDVIATLAAQGVERGMDVYICTSDKDARQLIGPHCFVYNLRKQQVMDEAALQAEWGIRPDQVVDLLTLTGDSVDNVPGVPGIGPKTASQLLNQFGTLDAMLERVGEVSGAKKQEALRAHAESARLGRRLILLRRDVPIELDWDAMRYRGYDARALKDLCTECGFHQFRAELVDTEAPDETTWDTSAYVVVDTPEALARLAEELRGRKKFSFDTETTSIDPLKARLVGMSFSWEPGQGYYVAVRGPLGSRVLDEEEVLRQLGPILSNPDVEIVGQNLKYDMLVLLRSGLELSPQVTDTMVLSYLLESGERNHNLDELSRRLLDHAMIPIESLIGKGKTQRGMDQVPVADVAAYAGEDADAAWRIEQILRPEIERSGLWSLYAVVERPLIFVLARMEKHGIKVDVRKLRALSDEFAGRLEQIKAEIYGLAGKTFNIGSGPQLRQVLFDELKLPVSKKTPKGEASTDADVLEALAASHPLPRLIVQHRQLEKLKNTYLDALPTMVHDDGRIHSSFSQVVAATGRLSSSDPNLQNIPVRTEDGRQIRQAFVAGFAGWSLVTADYSQIELRVLAHYSRDEALIKAFAEDRDIHAEVAARIYGVPIEQVTSRQRSAAKTVNFGVIYGLSPFGLAARLGIPQSEAARFIDAYFREYTGVERFIDESRESARVNGRVETILGRRRAIAGVKNVTGRHLNLAERTAVNTIIQGSAADLIKKAMLKTDEAIRARELEARMLLQIHDELVFEAPDSEIEILTELVRDAMTTALPLDVPLKVDLARGLNWLDTVAIE